MIIITVFALQVLLFLAVIWYFVWECTVGIPTRWEKHREELFGKDYKKRMYPNE